MKEATYDDLAALPLLKSYEQAFFRATKVSLKLLPPDEMRRRANLRQSENPFCALVASTPEGCAACLKTQSCIERSVAKEIAPQQVYCFAGLTDIAIPVMVGNRHVATLLSGQIFRKPPLPGDFAKAMKQIGDPRDKGWVKMARQAYFSTPVIPKSNLQGVIQLLVMFAGQLPDGVNRHLMLARPEPEHGAVAGAKRFIEAHSGENITLEQVLRHVHVSRFYFCKIFKKATGVTFTEYVARVRVEKAKTLLLDPSLRVSEIVFAAGFGSIPQFNSVFKRFAGMAPTEYRGRMRGNPQGDGLRIMDCTVDEVTLRNFRISPSEEAEMFGNVIYPLPFKREEESGTLRRRLAQE